MKTITIAIFGLFIVVNLIATPAYAQEPEVNPALVASGLADPTFWVAFVATLVAGAVGGVVYELLILQGNLELPHRPTEEELTGQYPHAITRNLYDLGIWARVIIGALAAVAALLVFTPATTFGLLSTAVVAGSAGTSIFRSMQDRVSVAIAQQDAANARTIAEKQSTKVDDALGAFADLKRKLVEASVSPPGMETLDFGADTPVALNLEDLDRVEALLHEAKGLHAGI
jgi:hypothetical protein